MPYIYAQAQALDFTHPNKCTRCLYRSTSIARHTVVPTNDCVHSNRNKENALNSFMAGMNPRALNQCTHTQTHRVKRNLFFFFKSKNECTHNRECMRTWMERKKRTSALWLMAYRWTNIDFLCASILKPFSNSENWKKKHNYNQIRAAFMTCTMGA